MPRHPQFALLAALAVFAGSGATCQRMWLVPQNNPIPVVFTAPPTQEQLIATVNAQTDRVKNLQTNGASLALPGFPALRAEIAAERPRRFRLRAGTGLTGTELDLGSNDELFWVWLQRNEPKAMYFCRHTDFDRSAIKQTLPVEPEWLAATFGLMRFEPHLQHDGPFARGEGQVEMRTYLPSAGGTQTRVTVIDSVRGYVVGQHLYDAQGQRLASAVASEHQYQPQTGVTLPHKIEIQIPPAQMNFTINVIEYVVNQPPFEGEQIWQMPQIPGVPVVNLAEPPPQAVPAGHAPPAWTPADQPYRPSLIRNARRAEQQRRRAAVH